jgi:hypothetical protein
MESEPGLVIPVETILVSQGTAISSQGENSIVTSRATTNLRQVMVAAQATDGQSAYSYPSVSCFPDAGFQSVQWRVGSLYFPSQPADTMARAAMTAYAAFGEPASTDKQSIWNRFNYDTTTQVGGAVVYVNRPAAGGLVSSTPAATTLRYAYSDFAPKAYCFDSYKNTSDPLDADGISVLGQAGSQIVTALRTLQPALGASGANSNITPVVLLKATKYLHLKNGGLRVVGA